MPWTLYRYILAELLKLMGLTTAVLVVVLSFAAAVQPLSDGQLSMTLLAKFVVYTVPTVLGFALPFAGAFAGTLVFLRMASDNEVLACSASGISYLRLLLPVLALGVALTGAMLYLSNYVVPGFFKAAERTVQSDAVSVLVSQLNQRGYFEVREQGLVIYADRATRFPPQRMEDSALPMRELIELEGVAVGETDGRGKIVQDTTAENATLMVFADPETDDAWVRLHLTGVVRYDPATGGLGLVEQLTTRPIRIPSPLSDNPKFFSARELASHERDPKQYDSVKLRMEELTSALATESLRNALVRLKDRAVLRGPLRGDRYVLSTPRIEEDGDTLRLSAAPGRPVIVAYHNDGDATDRAARVYEAQSATVRVRSNALTPEPSIDIDLHDVTVRGPDNGPVVGQRTVPLRQLSWPEFLPDKLDKLRAEQLLAEAARDVYAGSSAVENKIERLNETLDRLVVRITAQRHERAASAVSCLMLLLLGSLLSVRLRGQTPLAVYFWSFMLAIVTLILISSGVNVAGSSAMSLGIGMGVVWSGNILLLIVGVIVYRQLARN